MIGAFSQLVCMYGAAQAGWLTLALAENPLTMFIKIHNRWEKEPLKTLIVKFSNQNNISLPGNKWTTFLHIHVLIEHRCGDQNELLQYRLWHNVHIIGGSPPPPPIKLIIMGESN